MGTGPIPSSRMALGCASWSIKAPDLLEPIEALPARVLLVNEDLGWDPAKANINGSAIALGHPVGASGNRIPLTMLHKWFGAVSGSGLVTS